MLRHFRQRKSIKQFVKHLPLDLARRNGERRHYSLDEVTTAVKGGPYDAAFLAYAHALFCTRRDFDACYQPLKLRTSYDSLRAKVARRFFEGVCTFDAASLIRFAKGTESDSYYESGLGEI